MSYRAAALKYNIAKSTIRDNVAGIVKGKRPGPQALLTEEEEQILVNYINISARRAMPVTKDKILDTVAALLEEEELKGIKRPRPIGCDKPNYRPSKSWWYAFRQRNPSVSIRTPESLSRSRKSVTKQSVMQWFSGAKEHFTEEDMESVLLDPSR